MPQPAVSACLPAYLFYEFVMRLFLSLFSPPFCQLFCALCLLLPVLIQPAFALEDKAALLSVVEQSCTKACLEGRGGQAYCTKYCGCVRGQVEGLAKDSDITTVLEKTDQQQQLIQQCSGETAVSLFASSCREKCKNSSKCTAYCGCLKTKITQDREPADIGKFFISLGQNEEGAVGLLKGFEAACTKP